jgi:hypothetical protein
MTTNHTLCLHRLTSNSSLTTNFRWLFPTDSILVIRCIPILLVLDSLLLQKDSRYIESDRTPRRTRVTCKNAWCGPHRKHLLCCQNACLLARYPTLGIVRTTQKTFLPIPFLLLCDRISGIA